MNNSVQAITSATYQPDDPSNIYVVTIRVRATLHAADASNALVGEARRAIHIFNDTTALAKFPVKLSGSGESSPKIVDLLGDGKREIVAGDSGGAVHAIRADGTELTGWPVHTELVPLIDPATTIGKSHLTATAFSTISPTEHAGILGAVAVGDVDGDGKPEVVATTLGGHVWAYHTDGSTVVGFPVAIDFDSVAVAVDANHAIANAISAAPALADMNADGKLDIVVASQEGKVYVWSGGGERIAGFPVIVADPAFTDDITAAAPRQRTPILGAPAVGDVNGDGILRSQSPPQRTTATAGACI